MRADDTSGSISWYSPEKTFEGLSNLTEVHLNNLNINDTTLPYMLLTFLTYNYSLEVLDVAHNDISLTSSWMQTFTDNMPTLEAVDFSNNHGAVYETCFYSYNITTLNVNNLKCYLDGDIKCSNLVSLHFSNSEIDIDTYSSPPVIHAPCLEELYLSGITLSIFYEPAIKILKYFDVPQLKTLDLSSNQILVIDKEDAQRLSNVTYLDLKNNKLTFVSNLKHCHNVNVLLLSGNQITTVPKYLLSNSHLQILDLHDNSFACDCNIEGLQKWVLTNEVVNLWNNFSEAQRYKCLEPDTSQGLSITEINLDYCEVQVPLVKYISISVTSVLVTIIAVTLVVWYRWHIQYRLFLLFNRRAYQNYLVNDDDADDDFEDEDGPPRYDAYVIYHNQDEDWVDEQLVANIEEDHEEPFRLCLKNRDIRAGRLIFNELSLHIRRSRKTLVILTPCFVEDNWCYFQLNMAHHRVLEENHNVLIFIMLEEIPNNQLTLLLRQLFCRSQRLKWPNDERGQNLFWRCLREELKRPVPRDNQVIQYRRYNI